MTIYEIKELVELADSNNRFFFSRKTLRFFGQTLKSFSVRKCKDGRFYIGAPMRDRNNRFMGMTERFFNPATSQLERS